MLVFVFHTVLSVLQVVVASFEKSQCLFDFGSLFKYALPTRTSFLSVNLQCVTRK